MLRRWLVGLPRRERVFFFDRVEKSLLMVWVSCIAMVALAFRALGGVQKVVVLESLHCAKCSDIA